MTFYWVIDIQNNKPFAFFDKRADAEKFAKDIKAEFPSIRVKVVKEVKC